MLTSRLGGINATALHKNTLFYEFFMVLMYRSGIYATLVEQTLIEINITGASPAPTF